MKFTLGWLKDHLDTDASLQEIADRLTAIGLEVEDVVNPGEALDAFRTARIEQAVPHPDADKLRVCTVNAGSAKLQIVCGAPNARAGIDVVLAPVGAVVPANGMVIRQSKIRGVESQGMLCSARELGLGDADTGIMELPEGAEPGQKITEFLGLDDPVIHIAITPNRADCLGVRGIARDLAAAGCGVVKPLPAATTSFSGNSSITVFITDDGCREFMGCRISGVANGSSPEWLRNRMKAIGLRPISALVDITNYLTFDLARPLHVYDAAKLSGDVTVRPTQTGESLEALNDKTYTVPAGHIGITDASGLIGLGGVIGGIGTGVDAQTTDVFVEAAWFDPKRVAAAGRELQIDSDARYRFERGVDPAFVEEGLRQAVRLIVECCGGTASELVRAGTPMEWRRTIAFDTTRINRLTGLDLDEQTQRSILISLGFTIDDGLATPPSWRLDIEGVADLAEEIARIHGYDKLAETPLPKLPRIGADILSPMQRRVAKVRRQLAARGLQEVCSWSFMPSPLAELFGGAPAALRLVNPISSELDQMRPSILPNLLQAAARNSSRGFLTQSLFEVGLQFTDVGEKGQQWMASFIRCGEAETASGHGKGRGVDLYDAKADAIATIEAAGFDAAQLQISAQAPEWYHPGRAGSLMLGKVAVAYIGELHPDILGRLDAPDRTVACEIFLQKIPLAKRKQTARSAFTASDYQAVSRDFAFVADESLPADSLLRAVAAGDKALIKDVQLFDIYRGQSLGMDRKSLAVTVTMQANDRTLSEQEIDQVGQRIVEQARKIGATLRA